MTDEQYRVIQDGVTKSVTATEKPFYTGKTVLFWVVGITLGVVLWIIIDLLLNPKSNQAHGLVTEQPTVVTETRRITDKEFCAPIAVNGRPFRTELRPDTALIARINGKGSLIRIPKGGTRMDVGSAVNIIEYEIDKAADPNVGSADLSVYIGR